MERPWAVRAGSCAGRRPLIIHAARGALERAVMGGAVTAHTRAS